MAHQTASLQPPPLAPLRASSSPTATPVPRARGPEHHPFILAGVILAHGLLLLLSQLSTATPSVEPPPIQVALITPPTPEPVAPAPEPPRPKIPPTVKKALPPKPKPLPTPPAPAQTTAPAAAPTLSDSPSALTAPATTSPEASSAPPGKVQEASAVVVFVPVNINAAYLANPAPPYPPLSRRLREQGKVDLRVLVSADGHPEQVDVKTSSGFSRLDNAALEAVRRWRFTPARQGERSIASTVVVPIIFRLEES